jgi:hypothetical protein
VGQDGGGYTGDLRFRKIRIFLQRGLDRFLLICPSGCGFGETLAVARNIKGVAAAFAR